VAVSSVHGFPRIGGRRELKVATEGYWAGRVSADELHETACRLRRENWRLMRDAGVDLVPSNDFSYYDQVLDTTALVGAVPPRYGSPGGDVDLDTYFAMARGRQDGGVDVTAMEMTKWFDTNYHYIVPELGPEVSFSLGSSKPFDEYVEARELGIQTKPVLIGPVTYLLLGKPGEGVDEDFDRLLLLDALLDVFAEVIGKLGELGADWIELHEPAFVQDREEAELDALRRAYQRLAAVQGRPRICVTTYFDHVGGAMPVLDELPIEAVGLDLNRGPRNLDLLEEAGGLGDKALFAGLVDGRNVWINDLRASLGKLEELRALAGELVVSTSCSLQHVPIDLDAETVLDEELKSWMAFARQKLAEVVTLAKGADDPGSIAGELERNAAALGARARSPRTGNPAVRGRVSALTEEDLRRASAFEVRRAPQRERLDLPAFPTTTIGSFPQTADVRAVRAALRSGEIGEAEYERRIKDEIERVIRLQEDLGLDVLVHGEPERNDMVQYFGEQMEGYTFTENAWVQSYGSRYVRPPIIFGDVARPHPMTVAWITYAQSLTEKPVKGMLTGPVTMLKWSFVRDDQPESDTCRQIALAIRDEVADLEAAGVGIVQVDEPAIREGLPLRRERWGEYLDWAVRGFRLATSGVRDETQVQTHMCYSEFGDILEQIQRMNADVLLIEAARSRMELLHDWARTRYDKDVGPGVYDIHSPRVPPAEEMAELLREAARVLDPEQLWVNPDCGLKTRRYEEAEPALRNMVQAARQLREELQPAPH
jgi:5-methyltetrahydropteroyltriglutamate--homocysteine methyltransferase